MNEQNRAVQQRVQVVGDDSVAVIAAQTIPEPVRFVGFDERTVDDVSSSVDEAHLVESADSISLPEKIDIGIVAGASDRRNLLSAQRLRLASDDVTLIVRLNNPRNRSAFSELDLQTVCSATQVGTALSDARTRDR